MLNRFLESPLLANKVMLPPDGKKVSIAESIALFPVTLEAAIFAEVLGRVAPINISPLV